MTDSVIKFLTMKESPAESFARWMSKRREQLGITLDVLEERTGIKKQHLSVLERASPHSLTGKAVVPKRPTVDKIARGLESSSDEALKAAGYAPTSDVQLIRDRIKVSDFDEFDEKDLADIAEYIALKKLKNQK